MCNTRAYRHACGHHTVRQVSSCRGTYADPRSATALCHAIPTFTVALAEACLPCQYAEFSRGWEARIDEAESRRSVATQVVLELEDDWVECNESADVDAGVDYGNSERAAARLRRAKVEGSRAQHELERLCAQHEREQRAVWRSYARNQEQPEPQRPRKKQPAARRPGATPLREAVSIDEIEFEEDARNHAADEVLRRESFATDGTDSDWSDATDITPPDSPPGERTASFDKTGATWFPDSSNLSGALVDDELDDLLPNFGFA